ncbi:MAG TPA: inorganic pyrophosphatase [Polyangiaceae bacterium]|nr:inorganic pyrophosphatase [Polyangiaceae bacterium]
MSTAFKGPQQLFASLFQAHPWHGVSSKVGRGELLNAFIEIVPTDGIKYELDKQSGHLRVDRPQRFSSRCPTLYGFIPQTYCGARVGQRSSERTGGDEIRGDNDPLDICVMTEHPAVHGILVHAKAIGGFRMIDGEEADDKIIAVMESDPAFGHFENISDCPSLLIERIEHYFLTYKQRPDSAPRNVRIAEIYDQAEAHAVIELSMQDYREMYGSPEERLAELLKFVRTR